MSQQTRQFDESLADAADLLVREYGVGGAIEQLNDRRPDERATEALAYVKRHYEGDEDAHNRPI